MTRIVCLTALHAALLGEVVPFDIFARPPYEAGIPRPEAVLGYPIGERHTFHHRMETYLHRLQEAAPREDRVLRRLV